jgi:hypothetical protein
MSSFDSRATATLSLLDLGSIIVAELLESGRHRHNYFSWDAHLKTLNLKPTYLLFFLF